VHRTSIDRTTINIECVGSIDGLAHNENVDLLVESIYLYHQISIILNLIDASFPREKLIIELTQQAFPRCDRPMFVGVQPRPGSIVKKEREKSKLDRLFREVWILNVALIALNHMAIRIFKIQAMK
jgi:hypothetical protein